MSGGDIIHWTFITWVKIWDFLIKIYFIRRLDENLDFVINFTREKFKFMPENKVCHFFDLLVLKNTFVQA